MVNRLALLECVFKKDESVFCLNICFERRNNRVGETERNFPSADSLRSWPQHGLGQATAVARNLSRFPMQMAGPKCLGCLLPVQESVAGS